MHGVTMKFFFSNQDYLRAGTTVRWPITEQR